MRILEQSAAFTFRAGPFVDSTDSVTAETGLSIAQADIQISKNGGAFAQTSASSPTTTHDTDGWYQLPLTATDTATLGPLTVQIAMSGALPVWEHFMVVPATVYNALVNGTGNGVRATVTNAVDVTTIESADATDQIRDAAKVALQDYKLDKFISAAISDSDVTDDSALGQMSATDGDYSNFNKATDSLQALRDRGDSAWTTGSGGGSGSGAYAITINVKDDAAANVQGAFVRMEESSNSFTATTDASGNATFSLDAATYTASITKSGHTHTPESVIISVSGTHNLTIDGSGITASSAGQSTGVITCYDENGAAEDDVTIYVQCIGKSSSAPDGVAADDKQRSATTSGGTGIAQFAGLLVGFRYKVWRGTSTEGELGGASGGVPAEFTVPVTDPFDIESVIGNDE